MANINKIRLSGTTYNIQDPNAQPLLTAGQGITIENNVISATGGGSEVSSAITSGDTNAVAGGAVYDKFDEVEQVTAAGLNALNDKINPTVELTQEQYDALVSGGTVDSNTYYIITDAQPVDISNYWTSAQTNSAINAAVANKVDKSAVTSSVTSASTDTEIPTAKAVYDAVEQGGGGSYSAGTNISIANDTISCTLPFTITGSDSTSLKINGDSGTIEQKTSFAYGNNLNIRATDYHSSAAFGDSNTTYGQSSFICGRNNTINNLGGFGFVCGDHNTIGFYAVAGHIEGAYNTIYEQSRYAHAEGYYTTAKGYYTHTEGQYTITNNDSEHASGQYNASLRGSSTFGDSGNTLFSVGNGTANNARHNAFEIRQNGDIYLTKDGVDIKLQDNLGGGSVSSAITSGDTNAVAGGAVYNKFDEVEQVTAAALNNINDRLSEDEEVTAAGLNAVNGKFGGLKLEQITQSAYDALVTKDASTLYIIVN